MTATYINPFFSSGTAGDMGPHKGRTPAHTAAANGRDSCLLTLGELDADLKFKLKKCVYLCQPDFQFRNSLFVPEQFCLFRNKKYR